MRRAKSLWSGDRLEK